MTTTTTKARPRIAQGTVNYLTDLVRDRDVDPGKDATECLAELAKWLANPTTTQKMASDMVDRVKGKPRRAALAPVQVAGHQVYVPYPSVPASVPNSKFAVLTELLTEVPEAWRRQEYLFFEVKELRKRRVVRRLLGAPGRPGAPGSRFNRTALPAAAASELFGHLENEAFAYRAALTFGEIYQCCGRCAAELTDDQSRERKFGPICWDLMAGHRAAAGL